MEREGPDIHINLSCFRCRWESGEYYAVQSDTGFDYYCNHPSFDAKKFIGINTHTPKWCPLRITVLQQRLEKELNDISEQLK